MMDMAKNSDHNNKDWYRVEDRAALAREVQAAVDGRYGSQLAAASASGISQPMLSRLSRGRVGRIGESMRQKLLHLVPPSRRAAVGEALLSPSNRRVLGAYHEWLSRAEEQLLREHRHWFVGEGSDEVRESVGAYLSVAKVDEFWNLLVRLYKLCAPELTSFAHALHRRGYIDDHYTARRVSLAVLRVLAPLMDYREAGFVERRAEELDDVTFCRFVRAGLERELILLDRPPDEQRAQQVTDRYSSFWEGERVSPHPGEFVLIPELYHPDFPDLIDHDRLTRWAAQLIRRVLSAPPPSDTAGTRGRFHQRLGKDERPLVEAEPDRSNKKVVSQPSGSTATQPRHSVRSFTATTPLSDAARQAMEAVQRERERLNFPAPYTPERLGRGKKLRAKRRGAR